MLTPDDMIPESSSYIKQAITAPALTSQTEPGSGVDHRFGLAFFHLGQHAVDDIMMLGAGAVMSYDGWYSVLVSMRVLFGR